MTAGSIRAVTKNVKPTTNPSAQAGTVGVNGAAVARRPLSSFKAHSFDMTTNTFRYPSLRQLATLLAAGCIAALAPGQAAAQSAGHRVMTMTRGVSVFGKAETELAEVMKSHDAEAIDRIVGIEFEQRSAGAPSMPVPRGDWLDQAPAEFAHAAGMRDIAVHEYGDVAVVSFTWLRDRPQAPTFVVDVWRRKAAEEPYQIVSRYLSPLPKPAAAAKRRAGAASAAVPVDTKK
jgi:hypothetical protein